MKRVQHMLILCHFLPDSACGLLLPPTFSPFTFLLIAFLFITVLYGLVQILQSKIVSIIFVIIRLVIQRLNIGKGHTKPQFYHYNYKINQCYSTEKVILMIKMSLFCSDFRKHLCTRVVDTMFQGHVPCIVDDDQEVGNSIQFSVGWGVRGGECYDLGHDFEVDIHVVRER